MPRNGVHNATVKSTFLGIEDHGIFTFSIMLDFGSSVQGFGGPTLTASWGGEYLAEVLEAVGVRSWERLPGTNVRARRNSNGILDAIGHIVEDRWFDREEFCQRHGIE